MLQDHLIRDMASAVVHSLGMVSEHTTEKIEDALRDVWEDKIAIVWDVDDVVCRAKERDIDLSVVEARDILDVCQHKHDCTVGLTWEVIDIHTDWYLDEG